MSDRFDLGNISDIKSLISLWEYALYTHPDETQFTLHGAPLQVKDVLICDHNGSFYGIRSEWLIPGVKKFCSSDYDAESLICTEWGCPQVISITFTYKVKKEVLVANAESKGYKATPYKKSFRLKNHANDRIAIITPTRIMLSHDPDPDKRDLALIWQDLTT